MHKFNSLKFTYVSQEAIQVYVHRRDTVETLQGIAAHQPLGGRWAGLWDLACKSHILSITWFDGCYYMGRLPIGLWGADTLVSHWRLYVAYAVWRGAFTAPIACLCCIFAHMSDLHVFMLLMEHYLLRGAWVGWEEDGWSSLLRLQDLGKWHGLICTFVTWIDWRCFAACRAACHVVAMCYSCNPGLYICHVYFAPLFRYSFVHYREVVLRAGDTWRRYWKVWDQARAKES